MSEAATRALFFTIPFANLRGNVVRTFLGKSDFYWPLMLLAEQWQCSLYANVLFVQSSVPTMFLHFFANGRVTNRRVPPFPNRRPPDYHWGRIYYILNSEKIKSCKNAGLHYSN